MGRDDCVPLDLMRYPAAQMPETVGAAAGVGRVVFYCASNSRILSPFAATSMAKF